MTSRRSYLLLVAVLVTFGCAALLPAKSPHLTKIDEDEQVLTISSEALRFVDQRGGRFTFFGVDHDLDGIPAGESVRLKPTRYKDDQGRFRSVDFEATTFTDNRGRNGENTVSSEALMFVDQGDGKFAVIGTPLSIVGMSASESICLKVSRVKDEREHFVVAINTVNLEPGNTQDK